MKRNWKWFCRTTNIAMICVFVMMFINGYIYHRGCRSILLSNPFSITQFAHGYIGVLPEYMYSQEEFSEELPNVPSSLSNSVHYFWFDQKQFQFENYLSVLSAYRFLKPNRIIFHYCHLPELDSLGYYQFYAELTRSIPILIEEAIGSCVGGDERILFILSILNKSGGVYIGERTILANSLDNFKTKDLSYFINDYTESVIMLKRSLLSTQDVSYNDFNTLMNVYSPSLKCVDATLFMPEKHHCILTNQELFPKDIFTGDSNFNQLARWIYFGHKKSLESKKYETKLPMIVHYVWLGDRTMSFFDYLSLLSVVYIMKAEHVYIHGDIKPKGVYWQKAELIDNVHFIFRQFPRSVFGNKIVAFASHASDFLRGDLMVRYGGIYIDWDVIWLKNIPDTLRHYDLVVGVDPVTTGSFPDVFNMGVIMGQKGSKFMQYFLESYRHYLDKHWSYNAIHMPYKIYEKHPDFAHVERHLVVICSVGKCHPSWLPNYKEKSHLDGLKFDWRNETLSIHVTYPDPEEYSDLNTLLKSNSMFGDIGKYVINSVKDKQLLSGL